MKRYVFLVGCLLAGRAAAIQISDVQVDPAQIRPTQGEAATVAFTLDRAASVSVHWYDGLDRPVRTLGPTRLAPGRHTVAWDGRADDRSLVPAEVYVFTVEAAADDGTRALHDLTDLTGSQPITATDVVWDAGEKQVRFRLAQPARVNIRAGLKNHGPLLRTVIDWVPRRAGEHAEAWDGWDASQVLDLTAHPALLLAVDAYTLPDNTVFVGDPPDAIQLSETSLGQGPVRVRGTQPRKRMHYHADQPLDQRGDVSILLKVAAQTDDETTPTVSGRVPIRLDVAPKDRARILATRFEPVFFVDGTFAFENEVGFLPTTWIWDTTRVRNGWHYVTANVRGYEGNFGMATIRIKVENVEPGAQR